MEQKKLVRISAEVRSGTTRLAGPAFFEILSDLSVSLSTSESVTESTPL